MKYQWLFETAVVLVLVLGVAAIAMVAQRHFNRIPCKEGYVQVRDACVIGYPN